MARALPGTGTEGMGLIMSYYLIQAAQSDQDAAWLLLTDSGVELDDRSHREEFPRLSHSPTRYSCQIGGRHAGLVAEPRWRAWKTS